MLWTEEMRWGGLLARNSTLVLHHVSIRQNKGQNGGGGLYVENSTALLEDVFITNSIVWGNFGTALGDRVVASYSLIEGGYSREFILDQDPYFARIPLPESNTGYINFSPAPELSTWAQANM